MPRQPRLDIPNVLPHAIARGIEKRDIFVDDDDKERFLARLSSLLTKSSTKCFAWALLSNHFHELLTRGNSSRENKRLALTPDKLLKRVCVAIAVNEEDIPQKQKSRLSAFG